MKSRQMCIDFLEGRLDGRDFEIAIMTDDELEEWINTCIGKYRVSYVWDKVTLSVSEVPFSIRYEVENEGIGYIGGLVNLEATLDNLMRKDFPNVKVCPVNRYHALYDIYLAACPEYIDGPDVWKSGIIEGFIDACPEEWSKTRKIKYVKACIKEAFHLEGRKYPHWIQVPLWPFSNGKPMKYEKTVTVRKGEWYQHHFVNVDTGETCIVDDQD